jgi:hypothetical protein
MEKQHLIYLFLRLQVVDRIAVGKGEDGGDAGIANLQQRRKYIRRQARCMSNYLQILRNKQKSKDIRTYFRDIFVFLSHYSKHFLGL